ncbi:VOC family protein [Eupransor demetentiae]|uniref:Vicinal oxygen chelate (VOC) family (GloA) n=1 Tax=Eupransor demetentiae TaxID=3109584 RepID=A0ABP0EP71_9LACO|nr:3-dioxygenase or related enzyme [Lactobacillaceae bacterium LMG 33000]
MKFKNIDHLVLTVADISSSVNFYQDILGMEVEHFQNGRTALHLGACKINLHQIHHEFEPKSAKPTPGSGDFCLITETPIEQVLTELKAKNIQPIEGPEQKHGALGAMTSIYLRDPDNNLVEIAHYNQ